MRQAVLSGLGGHSCPWDVSHLRGRVAVRVPLEATLVKDREVFSRGFIAPELKASPSPLMDPLSKQRGQNIVQALG